MSSFGNRGPTIVCGYNPKTPIFLFFFKANMNTEVCRDQFCKLGITIRLEKSSHSHCDSARRRLAVEDEEGRFDASSAQGSELVFRIRNDPSKSVENGAFEGGVHSESSDSSEINSKEWVLLAVAFCAVISAILILATARRYHRNRTTLRQTKVAPTLPRKSIYI